MKINIENTARSVSNLFFSNHHSPDSGFLNCIGSGDHRIKEIIIPIYQRQYDWEKDELLRLLNNTEEYLLENSSGEGQVHYFVGTLLLELTEKKKESFELIDGQQRLTTTFLINFLGYLISIYRFKNFPSDAFSDRMKVIEPANRLKTIIDFEHRLFVPKNDKKIEEFNRIFSDEFQSYEGDDRIDIIDERLNIESTLEVLNPKLYHQNPTQRSTFLTSLKETHLEDVEGVLKLKLLEDNEFNERIYDTFDFLWKLCSDNCPGVSEDELLGAILKKIDDFSNSLSFCVLVSESPDDSFKLFEVLNSTGRTLTIIDKLKNYLYDQTVKVDEHLSDEEFNLKWLNLTTLQDSMGRANITTDLARSEHGLVKDKYYEYFTNQKIYKSNSHERLRLFKDESGIQFLDRVLYSAEMLSKIYNKDCFDINTKPHTLEWNAKIINRFGYDWGRQVLLGSYFLSRHLEKGDLFSDKESNWTQPRIDEEDTLKDLDEVTKFYSVLFDVMLKVGVVGIINGLSSRELPDISKNILMKIIKFVENKNKIEDLNTLRSEILTHFTAYISEHKVDFKNNLKSLRYTHSGDRKHLTTLLFILYNKGKGASFEFKSPSLEHFEPKKIPAGATSGYYKGKDRDEIVNSIGNMILMKARLNSKLGNVPIKEKIKKISNDDLFKNEVFFTHDIYNNLVVEKEISGDTGVFKGFPVIDKSKCYTTKYVPKKALFEERSKFYVNNLTEMICSTNTYLLSGEEYVEI